MTISRYELRKNYEEAEANAIGTEYLRAYLLPGDDALLSKYLDQRILFYETRISDSFGRSMPFAITLFEGQWVRMLTTSLAPGSHSLCLEESFSEWCIYPPDPPASCDCPQLKLFQPLLAYLAHY
jgi:hypothetical protein